MRADYDRSLCRFTLLLLCREFCGWRNLCVRIFCWFTNASLTPAWIQKHKNALCGLKKVFLSYYVRTTAWNSELRHRNGTIIFFAAATLLSSFIWCDPFSTAHLPYLDAKKIKKKCVFISFHSDTVPEQTNQNSSSILEREGRS